MNPALYLDYNGTTPLDPAVKEALLPFLEHDFGNPSTSYSLGRQAAQAVLCAREHVATLLGAQPSEIIFTSGATESITTAFHAALTAAPNKRHLITCATEHSATLQLCKHYASQGYDTTFLPVDAEGMLSLDALEKAITPSTALVSLLWANNETGVISPIQEIAALTERKNVPLHLDAVQAVGKLPIDLSSLPVHYLSLAGHKIYAPKGIGALYVHRHAPYAPLFHGSQENNRRGGTENVAFTVALGKAAELAQQHLPVAMIREALLRDRLEQGLLQELPHVFLNGNKTGRLSNTSNLRFEGIQAAEALLLLDAEGLCCSTGSACHTKSTTPSPVLTAMGLTSTEVRSSLRFSLGRFTTEEEINRALEMIPRVINKLRRL